MVALAVQTERKSSAPDTLDNQSPRSSAEPAAQVRDDRAQEENRKTEQRRLLHAMGLHLAGLELPEIPAGHFIPSARRDEDSKVANRVGRLDEAAETGRERAWQANAALANRLQVVAAVTQNDSGLAARAQSVATRIDNNTPKSSTAAPVTTNERGGDRQATRETSDGDGGLREHERALAAALYDIDANRNELRAISGEIITLAGSVDSDPAASSDARASMRATVNKARFVISGAEVTLRDASDRVRGGLHRMPRPEYYAAV